METTEALPSYEEELVDAWCYLNMFERAGGRVPEILWAILAEAVCGVMIVSEHGKCTYGSTVCSMEVIE